MQQPSKRLLPSAYDSTNIDIIDCTTSTPHATTSNSHHVDLRSTNAVPSLERTIRELIEARRRKLGPNGGITVLLDSVDELAERGVHGVVRILSGVLRSLGDGKNSALVYFSDRLFGADIDAQILESFCYIMRLTPHHQQR